MDYEKIYREAKALENKKNTEINDNDKNFPFKSLEDAFYTEDNSVGEHQDVYYENFVWDVTKSNNNLKDTGAGKGFSFYYAAQVFKDKFHHTEKNVNNPDHPNYDVTTGIVATKNAVVVVNTKLENGKIRIVSSWESQPESHWNNDYWKHRKNKEKHDLERQIEQTRKSSTYLLLRKTDDFPFNSDSYGKIVNLADLDFPPQGDYGSFMGKKVFIQTKGSYEECEHLQRVIAAHLKHRNTGVSW